MSPTVIGLYLLVLFGLVHQGVGLYCHRCYSAMGGCGERLDFWMFPWRGCGESDFCVKVIEKVGSDYKIIRECETKLMESTRHRMQMPVLRRHGYCLPARKNNMWDPMDTLDENIQYCFCNDFDGCNGADNIASAKMFPVMIASLAVYHLLRYLS